ncbi:LOW QUALITY PROTEIN: hypothetical protein V2J09_022802 [Rumex salicifolius]
MQDQGCEIRGGEFTSREFMEYCEFHDIRRLLTVPRYPQPNGVAERRNRTILDTTRSMLKAKKLPKEFWAEASHYLQEFHKTLCLHPALLCPCQQLILEMHLNPQAEAQGTLRLRSLEEIYEATDQVDNITQFCNNPELFKEFKEEMMKEFEMFDMGLMAYYMGIEGDAGIFKSQEGYTREILKKFKMEQCKFVTEFNKKLSKHDPGDRVDPTLFKSLVGSLRNLTCT